MQRIELQISLIKKTQKTEVFTFFYPDQRHITRKCAKFAYLFSHAHTLLHALCPRACARAILLNNRTRAKQFANRRKNETNNINYKKRSFMKNFYAKFLAILCTLMMAASSAYAQTGIQMPFGIGTSEGISYHAASGDWSSYTTLYGPFGSSDYYGNLKIACSEKNIVKVELYCQQTDEFSPFAEAFLTIVENDNKKGTITRSGNVATWEGNAPSVCFSASQSVDVVKYIVYLSSEEKTKEYTVDATGSLPKAGKLEVRKDENGRIEFSYITVYLSDTAIGTNYTGSANCPEGVTFKNSAGKEFEVEYLNYFDGLNYFSLHLGEDLTEYDTYTLTIPEGLVPFKNGGWNKAISVTWDIVAPDLRPTKQVVFDFKNGEVYKADGTTSYTEEEVVFDLFENVYKEQATGFRVASDQWVKFTAPEHTSLKGIQLLQESSYGVSPDFSASEGEVSFNEKTLIWSGNNASVTLTDNFGTCYFTKAIVTLAMDEPYVNKETYRDWKKLVTVDMKEVVEANKEVAVEDMPENIAAVVNYYNSISAKFEEWGDNWEAADAYCKENEKTITSSYDEASRIWNAYYYFIVTNINTVATTSNDSIYDLSGRRVVKAQNGLYIKNGKKVIR